MKKRIAITSCVALLGAVWATWAIAQEIEMKGVRVGMTKDELAAIVGKLPVTDFSLAGVESKYPSSPLTLQFDEGGKLVKALFIFHPRDFDQVWSAFRSKYSKMRCDKSEVSNRMGARFPQVVCMWASGGSVLALSRLTGDIETSTVSIGSIGWAEEQVRKKSAKQGDI